MVTSDSSIWTAGLSRKAQKERRTKNQTLNSNKQQKPFTAGIIFNSCYMGKNSFSDQHFLKNHFSFSCYMCKGNVKPIT